MILRPPRSTLLTHSFPTRRSSDLGTFSNKAADPDGDGRFATDEFGFVASDKGGPVRYGTHRQAAQWIINHGHKRRSEEHTSELQSLMRISYAVFCLKKKQKHKNHMKKNKKTNISTHMTQ